MEEVVGIGTLGLTITFGASVMGVDPLSGENLVGVFTGVTMYEAPLLGLLNPLVVASLLFFCEVLVSDNSSPAGVAAEPVMNKLAMPVSNSSVAVVAGAGSTVKASNSLTRSSPNLTRWRLQVLTAGMGIPL